MNFIGDKTMKYFLDGCSDIEVIIRNKRPSRNSIYSGYRPAFKSKMII